MIRPWRTLLLLITGIASLTTLALHGHLGYFSRYIADDFCSAGMARRFGIVRAVWYWYLNWTGRYSASALDAAFGLVGPVVTPFIAATALLIWFAALAHTAAALLPGVGRLRIAWAAIIAVTVLYVTLTLSPNVPQSLYWGQGMRSIVPPLVLSTIHVDYLARIVAKQRPDARRGLMPIPGFLLTFVIGGFNETYAALQFGALTIAWVIVLGLRVWSKRNQILDQLLAGALGAAAAFVVVAMSPGNAVRQAFYPAPPGLLDLLQIAWGNFAPFLANTIGAPERVLAISGAAALSAFIGLQIQGARLKMLAVPLPLVAGFGLAFASFVPAAYGLSDSPPERTLLIPAHLLTLAMVLAGVAFGRFVGQRAVAGRPRSMAEATILLLAAALSITSAMMLDRGLVSSRPVYVGYAAHWDAVNAQILNAREHGEGEIWIQPIPNWAGLNEPNDNPKFWVNVCLSDYYSIDVFGLDLP
ncbi:MAG: DUF6056 family protein [Chloroflexota bacterium]